MRLLRRINAACTLLLVVCVNQSVSAAPVCPQLTGVNVPGSAIGLPTRGASVTQTRLVNDASGVYCLVDGRIESVDNNAQNILFEMALPLQWNGKMLQLGGGGYDGHVNSPAQPFFPVAQTSLPARGYLVYSSDSGHQGKSDDASFAVNGEQLRNFAGDQVKKTHDVAVFLSKLFYGSTPHLSYFVGGSQGGRESFTAVQKFPQDYDGVISVFPVHAFMQLFMKSAAIYQAMRQKNGAGRLGPAEAELIERAELAACDKDDGVEDGIIGNPASCRFDLDTLRCPRRATQQSACLSDAQLATLRLIHSRQEIEATFADGTHFLPAFDIGFDIGAFLGNPFSQVASDGFLRYFVAQGRSITPPFDPYHPGYWRSRIEALSLMFDRTDSNVEPFVTKGGKWIVMQGLSDEYVPSQTSIAYYDTLVDKYGQAKVDGFFKLYLIPGYAHGHGRFDAYGPFIEALERWVEHGQPPETVTVLDRNPAAHGRSRPACRYPSFPKYKGTGEIDSAESFVCSGDEPVALSPSR